MDLTLKLLAAAVLIIVVTVIHGTGITLAGKLFNYEEGELKRRNLLFLEFHFLVPMSLFLFALHLVEITVFAGFYLAAGVVETVEGALFASAAAYTTLGLEKGVLGDWRLVGALEGLAGFLLIGWSVAVFIAEMEKVLRR